jgi:prepilin-type N-terminal cleavage/methylation domain-containing protein
MHNTHNSKGRRASSGFSLIELLIVVAIILIIAAIAIPNLLRSRMAANQASVVANLRTATTGLAWPLQNTRLYPARANQHSGYGASLLGEEND